VTPLGIHPHLSPPTNSFAAVENFLGGKNCLSIVLKICPPYGFPNSPFFSTTPPFKAKHKFIFIFFRLWVLSFSTREFYLFVNEPSKLPSFSPPVLIFFPPDFIPLLPTQFPKNGAHFPRDLRFLGVQVFFPTWVDFLSRLFFGLDFTTFIQKGFRAAALDSGFSLPAGSFSFVFLPLISFFPTHPVPVLMTTKWLNPPG